MPKFPKPFFRTARAATGACSGAGTAFEERQTAAAQPTVRSARRQYPACQIRLWSARRSDGSTMIGSFGSGTYIYNGTWHRITTLPAKLVG